MWPFGFASLAISKFARKYVDAHASIHHFRGKGEMALMESGLRTATVVAETDVTCLSLTRRSLVVLPNVMYRCFMALCMALRAYPRGLHWITLRRVCRIQGHSIATVLRVGMAA